MSNTKKTSSEISSLASEILRNSNSSEIQKKLAGSAMSQADKNHQTSKEMETVASKALNSDKYSDTTKKLAATVLSQSVKER